MVCEYKAEILCKNAVASNCDEMTIFLKSVDELEDEDENEKAVVPSPRQMAYEAAITGASELAKPLSGGGIGVPASCSAPLLSLMALLSSLTLLSLEPVESLLTSSAKMADFLGARQAGTSHATPVKLRILKPCFSHLRHGLPVRSRARRPALIAPMFALGPSLCIGVGAAKGPLWLGSLIMSPL
jgi:hypothetical protein